jgi:hypothetical protein
MTESLWATIATTGRGDHSWLMRTRLVLLMLLLSGACESGIAPSIDLAGTWAANFSIPGASLIITLDRVGNGTGTYAIEAGRSGTVQVTGMYARQAVALVLTYDYGQVQTFSGTLTDTNHITGSFGEVSGTVTFTRRSVPSP